MPEVQEKFDSWAIIEIMGHQRLAGHVTEQAVAGSALLRVDVPEVTTEPRWGNPGETIPAFTTFISSGSIYRMTPCTEEVAMAAIKQFRERPITCVAMPKALPPADPLVVAPPEMDDDDDGIDDEAEEAIGR